ncbi:hypothetical protein [Secundilactobacillus kimchicus]|uniref:hypothetical protein n=1 Tax=Secundilactobacillus kimchicus TaxID=528209 RepID=UPI0024A92CB5|nr:hypothetical protein [Secundilactobacillus kimchicus]
MAQNIQYFFQEALNKANVDEGNANNISAIVSYTLQKGVKALWMGDLETKFMENIQNEVKWPKVDVLFAPHHGRKTGKIPSDILEQLDPQVIILGHAENWEYMDYYGGYNTIKRTSGGDIQMDCSNGKIDFFSSEQSYTENFLEIDDSHSTHEGLYYFGSMKTRSR